MCDCFAVIADEVNDLFSKSGVLLLRFATMLHKIKLPLISWSMAVLYDTLVQHGHS